MQSKFRINGIAVLLFLLTCTVLLSGCAHNVDVKTCLAGEPYGFWSGLWHGIIAPVDFIVMLFNKNITLYAQNNNGAWYAFGFLIGSGGWGFLGGKGIARKRHRER
ncbi:MAG: hypothetical protein NTU98_03000 [Bacteroidetes bacterium]|nr:hypothetical protein [Bacteroidota bacterium]